jgi:CTP synthase (UTP-ammonia lyase)
MARIVGIGIVGDWNPRMPSHRATEEALGHAAGTLGVTVDCAWVSTQQVEDEGTKTPLARLDAIWCAPGSPYQSMNGALEAIRYARKGDLPVLAT